MPAFPPLVGAEPNCLVLGSMPGRISLDSQRYYAHRQNRFWWILANVYGWKPDASYAEHVAYALKHRVAIWDVLFDCERPGSLDSKIVTASERPNDICEFMQHHPTIDTVLFNGAAAYKIFRRHQRGFHSSFPSVKLLQLPSTSPAYASMSPNDKLRVWRRALLDV